MILTPTQRRAAERSLAASTNLEDRISFLEKVSAISPQYRERVDALRLRQQYIIELAKLALGADATQQ